MVRPLKGEVMSYTRAELAAGIAALLTQRPAHIHTDIMGFRAVHRRVCAKMAGRKTKPFVNQPNGDLAEAWYCALKAKGSHAV